MIRLSCVALFLLLFTVLGCTGLFGEKDANVVSEPDSIAATPETASNSDTAEGQSPTQATPNVGQQPPTQPDETSIVGTWKHVSTAKTPGGAREPLKTASIEWMFRADGTGSYKQVVKALPAASGDNPFKWQLKGNDIELTPSRAGRRTTYTIVERSPGRMTWKNHVLGDYYFVERQ